MSQKYTCKICKYSTDREYDYKKHQLTKKYIKICSVKLQDNSLISHNIKCIYCKKIIVYKKNLKTHHEKCQKYKKYIINKKFEAINGELKILQNELKHKNNKILELETTLKERDDTIYNTINKSIKKGNMLENREYQQQLETRYGNYT